MAIDDPVTSNVDTAISNAAGLPTEAETAKKQAALPIYKMMPQSKIPVSSKEAGLWKSRRDSGKQSISTLCRAWEEAESYYSLGQDTHRDETGGTQKGNARYARNSNRRYNSTENIVYSNVNAIIPAIIAKNPNAEVTPFLKELQQVAEVMKHLVNRLAEMKYAPGFNLKPKLRKCVVRTQISNESWIMVGYTMKEDSAQQAQQDLIELGKELVNAPDQKTIGEVEGKLMALEEVVDILNPAGPFVRTFNGRDVLVDPTSAEDDFSDAKWMMVCMMMPTNYLLAKYSEKDDSGSYVAIYNEQYIVNAGDAGQNEEESTLNNFRLLKETEDYRSAGYTSEQAFKKAQMTKVWYCFDKVKRRFLLIADEKWEWPLWVYDDPYKLPRFFPLHRLQYHTDPNKNRTKGEVSFYLDQQDELNDINSELNRMRSQIFNKMLYDSRYIDKDEFDKYMKGGDQLAYGVGKNLPEGMKMTDIIMAPPLPNLQYKDLFNKEPIYSVVDRISSTNDALRGAQFKTNTTNDAIGTYNSIQNQKLDEKIDAIEDFSGDVFYDIMFLCAQFMTQEEVKFILGDEAANWQQQEADVIRQQFTCTVLGGSTQKATSAAKKDQALQIGQIMGQYANASPYVVIIMLKAMEQAFDDIVVTSEDWQMIIQSIQMKMMQGQSAPGGVPQPGEGPSQPANDATSPTPGNPQPPPGQQPTQQQPVPRLPQGPPQPQPQAQAQAGPPGARPPANAQEQIQLQSAIAKLPPQAQKAIQMAVKKGVPEQDAYVEIVKELQRNPQAHSPIPQTPQPPTTQH